MRDDENSSLNRRDFLQTGIAIAATATAIGATASPAVAQEAANKVKVLPRRPLGKTVALGIPVRLIDRVRVLLDPDDARAAPCEDG